MSNATPAPGSFVVYAKDILKVAAFYERTLSLAQREAEFNFVLVGNDAIEIAVVRMPDAIAKEARVSNPPQLREGTPLKFSFSVRDLLRVHTEAVATGGGTKPLTEAWHWRGQSHLDGFDPEGNIVQFRTTGA